MARQPEKKKKQARSAPQGPHAPPLAPLEVDPTGGSEPVHDHEGDSEAESDQSGAHRRGEANVDRGAPERADDDEEHSGIER